MQMTLGYARAHGKALRFAGCDQRNQQILAKKNTFGKKNAEWRSI
jgi:hypothetical protein